MSTGCGLKGDETDDEGEDANQDRESCGGDDDPPDQVTEPERNDSLINTTRIAARVKATEFASMVSYLMFRECTDVM